MSAAHKIRNSIVKKMLDNEHNSCYVLITCSQPTEGGEMEVECTTGGDVAHALYLIESAQHHLHEQLDEPSVGFGG